MVYCLIDEQGAERLQLQLTDAQLNQLAEYAKNLTANNSALDIAEQFNAICTCSPRVTKITPSRRKAITEAQKEYDLIDIFRKVAKSPFLCGKNGRSWVADFDWILKPANLVKIYEENYSDNGGVAPNASFKPNALDELAWQRYDND